MAISISDQSLCDLWTESRQKAQSADPYDGGDRIALCPQSIGHGYKRDISLPNGIDLTLHRYQFHDDLISSQSHEQASGCLEWVFNLSSVYRFWDGSYINNQQHYVAGQFYTSFAGKQLARDGRLAVDIHLEPERFQALIGHRDEILSLEMQRLLTGDESLFFSSVKTITPAMQGVLQQILGCPYQGMVKQLFLESKSIELIALWLEQHSISSPTSPQIAGETRLNAGDRDRHPYHLHQPPTPSPRHRRKIYPSGNTSSDIHFWLSGYLATTELAIAPSHHYRILVLP
ncbi:MAG: hypothetical protein VKK04_15130 [Synechococcales bacterium]|nr:hypothetical protein [Synechococcales bacterium]